MTGASSGLGEATAQALALGGATVILAVRDRGRGETARRRILARTHEARVEIAELDLASLASVRACAERLHADGSPLDLLVNNAGVMATPLRRTADGFELQFGTNHLGHFALTGLVLPLLTRGSTPSGGDPRGSGSSGRSEAETAAGSPTRGSTPSGGDPRGSGSSGRSEAETAAGSLLGSPGARIVTVSSLAARGGAIDFDDLDAQRGYRPFGAYQQAKLANISFALELQRRLEEAGAAAISVAAHPGLASTNLMGHSAAMRGIPFAGVLNRIGSALLTQSAAHGALPVLHAATGPGVRGGEYWGPAWLGETRGPPAPASIPPAAADKVLAQRLWAESERRTGVSYHLGRGGVA